MKTRLCVVGMLLVIGAGTSGHLVACGDKYLMLGRGTRFDRAAARQASDVLIYANPSSELSRTLSKLAVEPGLHKAGFKPTTVTSAGALEQAMRTRTYDVVVVDGSDIDTVARLLKGAAAPHLVPVLHQTTKVYAAQTRKVYHTVINNPDDSRAFVETIDDAMDLVAKARR